ncbi:unnamed protein product [Sphagnum jensenii]|uniref:F5/8 type C domain-containing protein n=1 Tax=Sphagnum jensenii TaxID=128206 RepID=A0ABP0VA11_9BRYO
MALQLDQYGWSILPVYPNQLYVDSVNGNDANIGSITAPLKTINAAVGKLKPNTVVNTQINLKRGCTYNEALNNWWRYSNATLTAYGSGARPIVCHPAGNGNSTIHTAAKNVQFVSIDFVCGGHDPSLPTYGPANQAYGIWMDSGTNNVTIEDCRFEFFFQSIAASGGGTQFLDGLTVRRSVICDSHSASGHAQGAWLLMCSNCLFEECILDHNGWAQDASGKVYGQLDMFSHDVYGSDDGLLANVTFRNCMISRGGGNGLLLRQGGTVTGNLFIENGIHGQNLVIGGDNSTVNGNVFIGMLNTYVTPKGGGVDFEAANGTIADNLFIGVGPTWVGTGANAGPSQGWFILIDNVRESVTNPTKPMTVNVTNNIVYNYGGDGVYINNTTRDVINLTNNCVLGNTRKLINFPAMFTGITLSGNHWTIGANGPYGTGSFFYNGGANHNFAQFLKDSGAKDDQVAPKFVDATRTLETYAASIGLAADGPTLIAAMKNICKYNWNTALLPETIVGYLMEGYTISGLPTKLTGTIIGTQGSWNNVGNTLDKAFDGNGGTFFDGPVANGCWVGLDLGSPKVITSINFEPREGWTGYTARMVGGQFQGSNDPNFSYPTTLYTIATTPTPNDTVAIASTEAFRYVRYMSPDNSYGNIAELSFIGM